MSEPIELWLDLIEGVAHADEHCPAFENVTACGYGEPVEGFVACPKCIRYEHPRLLGTISSLDVGPDIPGGGAA
jgi:hypothetical protein